MTQSMGRLITLAAVLVAATMLPCALCGGNSLAGLRAVWLRASNPIAGLLQRSPDGHRRCRRHVALTRYQAMQKKCGGVQQ